MEGEQSESRHDDDDQCDEIGPFLKVQGDKIFFLMKP